MKGFLLWSLVFGFACLAAYVVLALWRKKPPVLQEGIAMFISGSGLVGGGKIFWLVFSGELSKLIQAHQSVLPPMFPRKMSFTLPLRDCPCLAFSGNHCQAAGHIFLGW